MKIKQLFKKDIAREIKGVIKVGQEAENDVRQELDEYVVTDELQAHFVYFFKQYLKSLNVPTDQMGVWISGFFGSGKSHFLKILSYLLDSNLEVGGKKAVEFFREKIQDQALLDQMQQVADAPSDIILFNTPSKSEDDNGDSKLSIVKVFNKVFNEKLGYSASIPWVAQMEEILDQNGQYKSFKQVFQAKSELAWEDAREEIYYNEDMIVETLVEVANMSEESARRWIDNGEESYEISVDSFAKRIKKYVDKQPADYHLVFLADEMGQFVSDDVHRMLDLQTIVEDLGKYTLGKVWVIVTSQQDIDELEKDIHSSQDFSKIQGRFNTRLSLSSANADEVIKKRLLEKNDTGKDAVQLLYTSEVKASLRNKINFSDGTISLKKYDTLKDFSEFYPMIPYQLDLLQQVFTKIRENSSAGKHFASGERNLLGAVQYAALEYAEKDLGILIPFQTFYGHLDQGLDHSVRATIIKAQSTPTLQSFDVDVLKVLYLIRYLKSVPSTVENITTLMLDELDADRLKLTENITAALDRLTKEYLVQRTGLEYLFLTNEEQDINREINHMDIPTSKMQSYIGEMIYDTVLEMKKYKYVPFAEKKTVAYDFDCAKWIDESARGNATAEIGIHVVTPYSDDYRTREELQQLSSRESRLVIALGDSGTFYDDTMMLLKINEYLRSQSSKQNSGIKREIIDRKSNERNDLMKSVERQVRETVQNATYYINGSEVSLAGNPTTKVDQGLHDVVENVYLKIKYINKFYDRDDFSGVISQGQINFLHDNSDDPNRLATDALEQYIQQHTERKMITSLFEIVQVFGKAPYGWREDDILVSLIRLLKDEKILFKSSGNTMNIHDAMFPRTIKQNPSQAKIMVEKRTVIGEELIRNAKVIAKEMYGKNLVSEKEDELKEETMRLFVGTQKAMANLQEEYRHRSYPGEKEIEALLQTLKEILKYQDADQFFRCLFDKRDELLDLYDDIQPVQSFFESQKPVFDTSFKLRKRYEIDKDLLQTAEAKAAGQRISEILAMSMPYDFIKELPDLNMQYEQALIAELDKESEPLLEVIQQKVATLEDTITAMETVRAKFEPVIKERFTLLKSKILTAETLTDLFSYRSQIDHLTQLLSTQINDFISKIQPKPIPPIPVSPKPPIDGGGGPVVVDPVTPVTKTPEFVHKNKLIPLNFEKIETEAELNDLLAAIHDELEKVLEQGKTIRFI